MVGFEAAAAEAGEPSAVSVFAAVCGAWPNQSLHLTGAAFVASRGITSSGGPGR
jgi:hypothetical protein